MALTLSAHSTGSKISTINLSKASRSQLINLSKEQPSLRKVLMKIVWEGDVDMDASVFMLDANQRGIVPNSAESMVYYDNLTAKGIKHSGDIREGGTEEITVDLNEVGNSVSSLLFVVTTHSEDLPSTPINGCKNGQVFVINADTNEALYQFDLEHLKSSSTTSLELASIKRQGDSWLFTQEQVEVGSHFMGLTPFIEKYIAA